MNLGIIKVQLEDFPFYPLTNGIKSYNLKSESDHRLIMRAVYPISVEYETDLGWKRLSDCRELQMTQDNCVILKFEGDFYHYTNYEGKVELRQKKSKCDVIYEKENMELYEKLGELEFLKRFNSFKYINITNEKNRLKSELQQFNEDEPQFESIDQQIKKLDRWIKEYLRWFFDYGFEIPQLSHQTKIKAKKSTKPYEDESLAKYYVEYIKETGKPNPTQLELEVYSNIPQSTWSKKLKKSSLRELIDKELSSLGEQTGIKHEVVANALSGNKDELEKIKRKDRKHREVQSEKVNPSIFQSEEDFNKIDDKIDMENEIRTWDNKKLIKKILELESGYKKSDLEKYDKEYLIQTLLGSIS